VVLIALAACGSAPEATTEFFGSKIEPPRGLEKIKYGMSVDEAMHVVPELHLPARAGVREELVLDSGVADVDLKVRIEGEHVASIIAIVQGHTARELLTRAWGEPKITRDVLGQPEITWANEATGWKVKLDCIERNCLVEYVPYKPVGEDLFSPAHVVPPGELSKLRIGMKVADARAVAPGPVEVRAGIPTGVDGVREFVAIDDKLATVRLIYLNVPPQADAVIEAAWGEPQTLIELGRAVKVWLDPATGWRATLRDALGSSHDLLFDNYLPAAQLLGEQPDRLDALPEPVLGKSADDVKKAYKTDVTTQGHDLMIALPPTEWERSTTRMTLELAGGRVKQITFSLPYKAHPDARDSLLDLFKHKWGDPKPIDEDGKPVLVFRDEEPHVEIVDDTEHGAWRIEIK
jgi:hypothetical protein